MNTGKSLSVACATLFFFTDPAAKADDIYLWAEETGGGVTISYAGSIDTTGFPSKTSFSGAAVIQPNFGAMLASDSSSDVYSAILPQGSSRTFGSGGLSSAASFSGSSFGIDAETSLVLPLDYASSSPISGSLGFSGETFASLGIDPTPFTFDTTVGDNTIHMFTMPPFLPPANPTAFDNASEKSALFRGIKGLQKKAKKLKKKGKKAKAKKLLKKVKKLKKQLKALG